MSHADVPLLFLLESRPPPTLTLFPYTTLFRSTSTSRTSSGTKTNPCTQRLWLALSAISRDRKSTRLNSSHEWISYAVFCLKKKKLIEDFERVLLWGVGLDHLALPNVSELAWPL